MSFFGEDASTDEEEEGVVRFEQIYVPWHAIRHGSQLYDLVNGPSRRSPQEVLRQHFASLCNGSATVLELRDVNVQHIIDMRHEATTGAEHAAASAQQEAIVHLHSAVMRTLQNTTGAKIEGICLGGKVLQLWTPAQQTAIYQALAGRHSGTMTHLHLGSHYANELGGLPRTYNTNDVCGVPTKQLMSTLASTDWPNLTNFQIRQVEIASAESIQYMVQFVHSISPVIKTFSLLGIVLSPSVTSYGNNNGAGAALLDPLLKALASCSKLSDLQLHRMVRDNETEEIGPTPLFSSQALMRCLVHAKTDWWSLTFDGMGLRDAHLEVLGSLMSSEDGRLHFRTLLSVRNNPHVSTTALASLYHVCMNKRGMGKVLSDDDNLNALHDVVRPLNNLHNRLDFKDDDGTFASVDQWLDWLQVLSNLRREDDACKLNYIWFTVLEEPTMIAAAIQACGSSRSSRHNKRIRRE